MYQILGEALGFLSIKESITQPPPKEGAWSVLFCNLSKPYIARPGLAIYVVKGFERPLLEKLSLSRIDVYFLFRILARVLFERVLHSRVRCI